MLLLYMIKELDESNFNHERIQALIKIVNEFLERNIKIL